MSDMVDGSVFEIMRSGSYGDAVARATVLPAMSQTCIALDSPNLVTASPGERCYRGMLQDEGRHDPQHGGVSSSGSVGDGWQRMCQTPPFGRPWRRG